MRRPSFLFHYGLALGIALLLLAAPAWGQDTPTERATLKRLPIVEVVVEEVDPALAQDGLTRPQLQTDVEGRLRRSGITVGPTLVGHLYVNVDTVKSDDGQAYAYNVVVQFVQQVRLVRDPTLFIFAPTWETGGVGMIAAGRLGEIRGAVNAFVDQFINAYREQNVNP